ncbi:hypothetical protein PV328_001268 [Microctonus aethiopoides]|uniref:ADAMTS cysteine-rich domain-containing protein n=1 Tax=Microctonus aethiopoides TaxID=144406 RepID=A0AA39KXG0_9HYME|nr:hypothetical protein PV328_001268 [Microctonus aethiopoides]
MKFQANSNTSGPNLYPELLVATSYDLHMAIDPRFWAPDNLARILGKNSHWSLGVKTVFHIITEYNAVDMIFQTVKSAKIKLNIAGIVIEAADDMDGPTSYLINIAACKQVFASSQVNSSQTSCLEWSKHAEEGFKSIHCDCVNYPRSLSQPVPKKIFSAHEQCRCYGHVSHVEPDDNISEDACNRSMYCRIEDPTKVATAPMPIDGTPCGRNKVCWNSKCLSLGET